MPRRQLALFALCVALLGVGGCDPGILTNYRQVGVMWGPSHQVRILVGHCPGERVLEVSLVNDDDRVLWEVDSKEGTQTYDFLVGTTPPGFQEAAPLAADSLPAGELDAVVTTSQMKDAYDPFTTSQLRTDQVLRGGRIRDDPIEDAYMSEAQFLSQELNCPAP